MTIENEGVIDASDTDDFASITTGKATEAPEALAPNETPKSEEPKAPAAVAQPEPPREDHRVPVGELVAERKARQQTERQLAELIAAINRNAPPPPPPPPGPDPFENPAEFARAQFEPEADRLYRIQMYNSRMIAEARYGEDKVSQAQQAFDALLAEQKLHPAEVHQVMNSPNPFAEAVKWHERHQVVSEVGNDPKAYRENLRKALLTDPEFRKEAMAAWQAEARQTQRSPVISLPSISNIGSAALPSGDEGGMSDRDEFEALTSRKRR